MCFPCKPLTCKLFYLEPYFCLIYVLLELLELLWLKFQFKYFLESKIVGKKNYVNKIVEKLCVLPVGRRDIFLCLVTQEQLIQARPQSAWWKSRCKSQDWWVHLPFSHVILEKNLCGYGPRKQVWRSSEGGGGRGVQEGGDMYVYI